MQMLLSLLKVYRQSLLRDTTRRVRYAREAKQVHALAVIIAKHLVSFRSLFVAQLLTLVVHVECAHQGGFVLGFDITPVKGSRRDHVNVVSINGETGTMTAAVWCKDHVPAKTIVHHMHDIVDVETGLNALQLYVRNFKQADLTLTGTVRKATLVNQSTTKAANQTTAPQSQSINRRSSTVANLNGNGRGSAAQSKAEENEAAEVKIEDEKICVTCDVDVSPKWWAFPPDPPKKSSTPAESAPVLNVEHIHTNGDTSSSLNGSVPQDQLLETCENGESQVALAVAALRDTKTPAPIPAPVVPTEFQCHQCHFKGIRKKEPTPPPPPSPSPPAPPVLRDSPRPSLGMPIASMLPSLEREAEPPLTQAPPPQAIPYQWPAPISYAPAVQPYWQHRSPAPHNSGPVHMMNGNHSPRMQNVPPPVNTQASMHARHSQSHSPYPLPPSPRQNGGSHHGLPNGVGYHPQSPHLAHINGGGHSYPSYSAATGRPTTHHLTNGGPPPMPRIPDREREREMHGYGQHGPPPVNVYGRQSSPGMHHRVSYGGGGHASPQMQMGQMQQRMERDPYRAALDPNIHPDLGGAGVEDRRVNGGASASPSLRNLLS